jgi:hypothetical protein
VIDVVPSVLPFRDRLNSQCNPLFALLERYYILNYVVPIIFLSKYESNFALYHYLSYIWWVKRNTLGKQSIIQA